MFLLKSWLWKYIPSSFQHARLSCWDQEVPTPSQTPLKLGIKKVVLPTACAFMSYRQEDGVGECHYPAALCCGCRQARPWVLRGGIGGDSWTLVLMPSHQLPGCCHGAATAVTDTSWICVLLPGSQVHVLFLTSIPSIAASPLPESLKTDVVVPLAEGY